LLTMSRTIFRICIAVMIAAGALAGLASPSRAGALDDALANFASDSFDDTETGIAGVAASGDARAAQILAGLRDDKLVYDAGIKRVFIKTDSGVRDAATGQPVADPPADLSDVAINNRLRRLIDATIGGLTLMSPNPAQRLAAAQAVFASRDANTLPVLDA